MKIDVAKDFAQFEKFVSLLKQLRANDKGSATKHVRWKYAPLLWYSWFKNGTHTPLCILPLQLPWSPRSPQPTAPRYTSPSKKFSRGLLSLQMARESKTEPHSMPLNRTAFYRSPPQHRTFPPGDSTPTKAQTGQPQQKTRRLLALPAVPKRSVTADRKLDDDDFETPVVKRPRMMPNAGQSAFRSLNFSSPKPAEAQLNG